MMYELKFLQLFGLSGFSPCLFCLMACGFWVWRTLMVDAMNVEALEESSLLFVVTIVEFVSLS